MVCLDHHPIVLDQRCRNWKVNAQNPCVTIVEGGIVSWKGRVDFDVRVIVFFKARTSMIGNNDALVAHKFDRFVVLLVVERADEVLLEVSEQVPVGGTWPGEQRSCKAEQWVIE